MQTATPSMQFDRDAYIDLVKRSITNYHYLGEDASFEQFRCVSHYDLDQGEWKIDRSVQPTTLLRKGQLDLIEQAVVALEADKVPGDYIEAGIWRGGVIILLRALMGAYNITGRTVVAADSFAGIPKNERALNDPVDLWTDRWVATLDEVRQNIERFGMLDDKVEFLPGFFADTLHTLENERFSLIRLDSDSYDSVETSLEYLYPLLSDGGIIIIDDWHLPGCRMAVLDYRAHFGITDPIYEHDANAYWTKKGSAPLPGLG
ncbi:MAG: TylF/MycF/NovP-related O-methyltransferase [Blastomonas sp.]